MVFVLTSSFQEWNETEGVLYLTYRDPEYYKNRVYRNSSRYGIEMFMTSQSGIEVPDTGSDTGFRFQSHPVSSLENGLDQIIEYINHPKWLDNNNTLVVSVPYNISRKTSTYVAREASSKGTEQGEPSENEPRELNVLNLYQYLSVPSTEKLANNIRQYLGTENLDPNNAMTLGYAICYTLNEGMI